MAKRAEILALRRQLAGEIVRALGPGGGYGPSDRFGITATRFWEFARGRVDHCSVEWMIDRIYRMYGSVTVTVTLGDARREQWIKRVRG